MASNEPDDHRQKTVFNPDRHNAALARAMTRFQPGHDFLMQRTVEDLMERLQTVNRQFERGVALFGRTPFLTEAMRASGKVKDVLRVEEASHLGNCDHVATPDVIGLAPQSVDLVIAPYGLHWANDLPGALIQLHTILKPDGLLLATLPGPDTLRELRTTLLQAESEITNGAAMRTDPLTDIRDAGALLQRAGFNLPVVDREDVTVRYDTPLALINDLRHFGAQNQSDGHPPLTRAVMARMMELYHEQFSDPDGRIRATFSTIFMSGWAPHESQQKPLKPGSAKTRLSDALKVPEIKLKP
ncbi:MAG: methyltransferase domain-containing protein [Pseudomonadota bacterium]